MHVQRRVEAAGRIVIAREECERRVLRVVVVSGQIRLPVAPGKVREGL